VAVLIHRSRLAEMVIAAHDSSCSSVLGIDICREALKVRNELIEALKRTYFWTSHYVVSGDYVLIVYGAGFNEVGIEAKRLDAVLEGYAPPHHRNPQPMLYGVDIWHFGSRTYEVVDIASFKAMLIELKRWLVGANGADAPSREVRTSVLSKIDAMFIRRQHGLHV